MKEKLMNNFKYINILVKSNITHEPYFKNVIYRIFKKTNIECNIIYSSLLEDIKKINEFQIVVVWINFEYLVPDYTFMFKDNDKRNETIIKSIIEQCLEIKKIVMNYNNLLFWIGFEDFYIKVFEIIGNIICKPSIVDILNLELYNLFKDITIIDLKRVISCIGIKQAYSEKNKYRWNSPYSEILYEEVSRDIVKQYVAESCVKYKCIVLDCDGVLWGGAISETSNADIKLGEHGEGKKYKDFQRYIYCLYCQGIIIALLSKNNRCDVIKMIRIHEEMVIKEENIAFVYASWENKIVGIEKIAEKLAIGLNNMIFIDDSEFEINQMNTFLPEVKSILFKHESIYSDLDIIVLKKYGKNFDQILLRNKTFRDNEKRNILKDNSKTYNEYLDTLQMEITIKEMDNYEIERISELSMRVNRMTNGKRYAKGELISLRSDMQSYAVYVKDIFGDMGLIGAIIINKDKLNLFCLSCRALGRNVEYKMIEYIKKNFTINTCFYSDTKKNNDIKNLLKNINNMIIYEE